MPRLAMPIAGAVALTVAATLSIATERAGSSYAMTLRPPVVLPPPKAAADGRAQPGVGSALSAPAVGSRAFGGNDEGLSEHSRPCPVGPDSRATD